jgi:hypothetical protein
MIRNPPKMIRVKVRAAQNDAPSTAAMIISAISLALESSTKGLLDNSQVMFPKQGLGYLWFA